MRGAYLVRLRLRLRLRVRVRATRSAMRGAYRAWMSS
jgi:hypothetical protein